MSHYFRRHLTRSGMQKQWEKLCIMWKENETNLWALNGCRGLMQCGSQWQFPDYSRFDFQ